MEIDIFLKEGEQTKIAENISKISSEFTEAGFDLIIQITKWIHKNLKSNQDKQLKTEVFRKRTAEQIIKDGFTTGCTDVALVFISLARAKKIPTKYVEAINMARSVFTNCSLFLKNKDIYKEMYIKAITKITICTKIRVFVYPYALS